MSTIKFEVGNIQEKVAGLPTMEANLAALSRLVASILMEMTWMGTRSITVGLVEESDNKNYRRESIVTVSLAGGNDLHMRMDERDECYNDRSKF